MTLWKTTMSSAPDLRITGVNDFHTLSFKDAYFCEGMSKDVLSMKVLIEKGCEFDMKRMRRYLPGLTDRYFKMIWKQ